MGEWSVGTNDGIIATLKHRGKRVAVVTGGERPEFIVRACNAHDGLVDAVETLLNAEWDLPNGDIDGYVLGVVTRKCRAALAKAKGE